MSSTNPLQRFDMTVEDIDRLMKAFYGRIRRHEILGPVFLKAVGEGRDEWIEHESKIASFWRNALFEYNDVVLIACLCSVNYSTSGSK